MKISPLTTALNHVLEPWAQRILIAHAGKVVCFDGGAFKFCWQVRADGLLQEPTPAIANVTIRFNWMDLPLMGQNPARAFSYVKIEGDADFANAISRISQAVRWDAEHDLSKLVGDIAAVRIVASTRAMLTGAKAAHEALTENIAEYFLEEQPMLVRPQAVSDFTEEVTRLRDDLERLTKRIHKLKLT